MAEVISMPVLLIGINELIGLLKKGIIYVYETIDGWIFYKIKFNRRENPRCEHAIIEEIKSLNLHLCDNELKVADGNGGPQFKVKNGTYKIETNEYGAIRIDISDRNITIRSFRFTSEMGNLIKFTKDTYTKHNAPSKILLYYTSKTEKWNNPTARIPRNFERLVLTESIKQLMDDVDKFKGQEYVYEYFGFPYKRGYFLYGDPGTGKSLAIELIATKYGMSIYMLNLNSHDMTDNSLINLIGKVAPNSLIVIEEVNEQFKTLSKNTTTNVSLGGLFVAMDGSFRLPHSCIFVLTSNTRNFLPEENMNTLLRRGRIDREFHFTEKLPDITEKIMDKSETSDMDDFVISDDEEDSDGDKDERTLISYDMYDFVISDDETSVNPLYTF